MPAAEAGAGGGKGAAALIVALSESGRRAWSRVGATAVWGGRGSDARGGVSGGLRGWRGERTAGRGRGEMAREGTRMHAQSRRQCQRRRAGESGVGLRGAGGAGGSRDVGQVQACVMRLLDVTSATRHHQPSPAPPRACYLATAPAFSRR